MFGLLQSSIGEYMLQHLCSFSNYITPYMLIIKMLFDSPFLHARVHMALANQLLLLYRTWIHFWGALLSCIKINSKLESCSLFYWLKPWYPKWRVTKIRFYLTRSLIWIAPVATARKVHDIAEANLFGLCLWTIPWNNSINRSSTNILQIDIAIVISPRQTFSCKTHTHLSKLEGFCHLCWGYQDSYFCWWHKSASTCAGCIQIHRLEVVSSTTLFVSADRWGN